MKSEVSIIIPAYNEEENILECIYRVKQIMKNDNHEIIVVNDGSQDHTKELVSKVCDVKLVSYENNRGKGYAIRRGLDAVNNDIVIIQDADMATPPEGIKDMIKPIIEGKADFVNGTRFVYPMEEGSMKKIHIFGNKIFAWVVSIIIQQKLTDTLCGFKAFRANKLKGLLKENSWPDFELILKAKKNNMRIVEVPIYYKARKKGKSKMKTFRHGLSMIKMLLRALLLSEFNL